MVGNIRLMTKPRMKQVFLRTVFLVVVAMLGCHKPDKSVPASFSKIPVNPERYHSQKLEFKSDPPALQDGAFPVNGVLTIDAKFESEAEIDDNAGVINLIHVRPDGDVVVGSGSFVAQRQQDNTLHFTVKVKLPGKPGEYTLWANLVGDDMAVYNQSIRVVEKN